MSTMPPPVSIASLSNDVRSNRQSDKRVTGRFPLEDGGTMQGLWLPLALYGLLTLSTIGFQCVSMDELVEIGIAKKSYLEILHEANSFPPLFHLLIAPLVAVCESPMAMRLFSFGCGGVAVAATWFAARALFSPRAAHAAATLVACSPLHIFYAQQGRAYALFYALTILTWYLLIRALESGRRSDWVYFVLAATAGCYTHYYFAIFLASAFFTAPLLINHRREFWHLTLAMLAIGVLSIPALSLLPGDFTYQAALRKPRLLSSATLAYTFLSFFTGTTLGPSQQELHAISTSEAATKILPWGIGILVAVGILAALAWQGTSRRKALLCALSMAILPIFLIGLAGWLGGLTYNIRFTGWCLFPLAIFLTAAFATDLPVDKPQQVPLPLARRGLRIAYLRSIALGTLMAIGLIALFNRNYVDRYRNEDLEAAAKVLQHEANPKQPVYVLSWYMAPVLQHYLPTDWQVRPLPDAEEGEDFPHECLEILRSASAQQGYWLVYCRPFHGDPDGTLLSQLIHDQLLERAGTFAGCELYRGKNQTLR